MKAIVNTKLLLENGIIWDGVLLYERDRIVARGPAEEIEVPEGAETIDAGGRYTAPGFIDIHVHGAAGRWFHEDPLPACEDLLAHGQTTVLPTMYPTIDLAGMLAGGETIRAAAGRGAGRIIGGLYMEGPYMQAGSGSMNSEMKWLGPIDPEEYIPLVDGLGDFVRVWCVDPAREGIDGFVAYAQKVAPNVRFSIGHSTASPEACRRLKRCGALCNQTHHGDSGLPAGALPGVAGEGPDEFSLSDSDIYCELICDYKGIHVRPQRLRMVAQTKGVDRVILITDHTNDSRNHPPAPDVAYSADLIYDDAGYLSGSQLHLDEAVRNMMMHTGFGLCHCVRFVTANPARMLGLSHEIGTLDPGSRADLVLIDDMAHVEKVILWGETVK